MGPGAKSLTGVQGSAPLCKKICIWRGKLHNFKPVSSLNLQVFIILGCKGAAIGELNMPNFRPFFGTI